MTSWAFWLHSRDMRVMNENTEYSSFDATLESVVAVTLAHLQQETEKFSISTRHCELLKAS